jgi:hypothetical protein
MSAIVLNLGILAPRGLIIRRSSVNWLCHDGYCCRANEVVAFCNLSVEAASTRPGEPAPFADEHVLQLAFAPRVAGRLTIAPGSSAGGYLGMLAGRAWDPDDVIGTLQPTGDVEFDGREPILGRLMLAGRRMGWAVDVDAGLLPGWHSRARGWWGAGDAGMTTVLAAGICDATGVVRGERSGFIEMFEAAPFPAHVVALSEHPVAPCAPVLLDQLDRTAADGERIREDILRALAAGPATPTPEDLMFMGAVSTQLQQAPLRERPQVLGTSGLSRPRVDAVLLSALAEPRSVLRHRRLGYRLQVLPHDTRAAGALARAWLRTAFEPVPRSVDDIQRDYADLCRRVREVLGGRLMIINRMSTSGLEDIFSYAAFDAPMGDTLANVQAKETNLMLEDLADDHDVDIVDADAIAAEIGGREHLPDGVHQSGPMQAMLRAEILGLLQAGGQSTTNSTTRSAPASASA